MGDRQQTLRAVLYQEESEWVAHCLDLDIVATGPTRDQAAKQLVEAVTAQIGYARDHQNYAYLYRRNCKLSPPKPAGGAGREAPDLP